MGNVVSRAVCAEGGFCHFVNSEIPRRRQKCVQRTCNPDAESYLLLLEILSVSFGEVVVSQSSAQVETHLNEAREPDKKTKHACANILHEYTCMLV